MKLDRLINRRNFNTRRIYIWDEITEDTAGHFVGCCDFYLSRSKDPIWVLLHTFGGSVHGATAIVDEMEAVRREGVQINICVLGMAYSAGAYILGLGNPGHRFVRPFSSVMMHPMSYGLGTDYAEMQQAATSFYAKEADRMNRQLAEACGRGGRKYHRFLRDISKGLWLNADEAIRYGVADKVWTGPLPGEASNFERTIPSGQPESGQPENPADSTPPLPPAA